MVFFYTVPLIILVGQWVFFGGTERVSRGTSFGILGFSVFFCVWYFVYKITLVSICGAFVPSKPRSVPQAFSLVGQLQLIKNKGLRYFVPLSHGFIKKRNRASHI